MKKFKWVLIIAMALLFGCAPKTNDGITPTQPAYTGGNLPNPFTLYNGSLAPGIGVTVYLPSPYTTTLNINAADTSITPISGKASYSFGISNYNPGSTGVTETWAQVLLIPTPASDGTVTPLNLSNSGFSQASFYSRIVGPNAGVTTVSVTFGAAGGSAVYTVNENWTAYSVSLANTSAVSQLFSAQLFSDTAPAPVTLYIDDIVYQ
jgi:hypothetical protein